MAALSRRKGADGEREVARLIHDLVGVRMRRRLSQYQSGGFDLEPADGSSLLAGHAIEVKRGRRATQATVARWWQETCEQAGNLTPVLWFRGDGEAWRVMCHVRIDERSITPILTPTDWSHCLHVKHDTLQPTVEVDTQVGSLLHPGKIAT